MYVNLYESTGDRKWLDRLVDHVDRLFANLHDEPRNPPHEWVSPRYRDGFFGFGQSRYEQYAPEYTEWMCDDGLVLAPVVRFIETVWNGPALHERYLGKADAWLRIIEDKIVEKWRRNWAADANQVLAAADRGYHLYEWSGWKHQPINMFLAFAAPLVTLDRLARSPHYKPVNPALPDFYAKEGPAMLEFFASQLEHDAQHDCYVWKYGPTSHWPNKVEDVGHAFIDIEAVLEGVRSGMVFTRTDLSRLARTFTRRVWNGSRESPAFTYFLDGRPGPHDQERGHWGFGFLYLARNEPAIRDAFSAWYAKFDFTDAPPHVAVTAAMLAIAHQAEPVP
jgi:hypothetical protein